MTYHDQKTDDSPRRSALIDEIEITSQMIEAGYPALEAARPTDDLLGADRLAVSEIFDAMYRARPAVDRGGRPKTKKTYYKPENIHRTSL